MKNISLLVARKQVDVGGLKSHPAPMEMHLLDVDHKQALGGVSALWGVQDLDCFPGRKLQNWR